jgi:hypothetical protein
VPLVCSREEATVSITAKPTLAAVDHAVAEDVLLTDEERRQRQIELNRPIIALLDSWLEGDEEDEREQRETLKALKRGIDEVRPPGLKLFP